jgi:hypothetical protein
MWKNREDRCLIRYLLRVPMGAENRGGSCIVRYLLGATMTQRVCTVFEKEIDLEERRSVGQK